jgi:MerR family transcriptional regulator, light-induced transcriptional regulator
MSPLPDVKVGNNEPLYNIGVVSRMTGVSMATLRAWERRYEFPESERTAGGHRLYSERDVMYLRWVKERIDEGMQTAQAINALRHQESTGHLLQVGSDVPLEPMRQASALDHLHTYQVRLIEVLTQRDLPAADIVLGDALAASSVDDLILDVIGPALAYFGDAWHAGQVSVATEHLATNYLRQRLLMWMMSGPPPRAKAPILMACGPNEWHEGSLLILGALLRRRGWPVAYLGQSLPLQDLAGFVRELNPAMVILVGMTESVAAEISEWPRYLPDVAQSGRPIVGYGGRVFTLQPDWRQRMPGYYLGNDFRSGLNTIERLLA